jgi:hypothetical protein
MPHCALPDREWRSCCDEMAGVGRELLPGGDELRRLRGWGIRLPCAMALARLLLDGGKLAGPPLNSDIHGLRTERRLP